VPTGHGDSAVLTPFGVDKVCGGIAIFINISVIEIRGY
jgi:hypothetical protein